MLGQKLTEASSSVVPIMATAGESIHKLRDWATSRCLSAETGRSYMPPSAEPIKAVKLATKPGRSVSKPNTRNDNN
jgi:hypothetical protein